MIILFVVKHNIDGQEAEKATIEYLKYDGFKILDHNWKTPRCEIDIVAKKGACVYFVEVKYRGSDSYGDGFEYITPAKQKQMAYAAEVWVSAHKWQGEYCLSAASVLGADFKVVFIKEI